jgi:hypothetical protein
MRINKRIFAIIFVILVIVTFKNWFLFGKIAGGDFSGFISKTVLIPYAWGNDLSGLGSSIISFSWSYFVLNIPLFFLKYLGANYDIAQKISFFYSFILISFFSSLYLCKKIFTIGKFYFLSPIIFIFNTYILMLAGGGQIIIALSYALSPFVFVSYISLINLKKKYLRNSILTGILLSFQIMLDLRIAYVVVIAIGIYWLYGLLENRTLRNLLKSFLFVILIPGLLSFFLNAFWLIPTLVTHQNPVGQLGDTYASFRAVQYFSFAKFENSISLLHPNWPENIFGKVGFMRSEFILFPILAFSSLFFIKNEEKNRKKYVLFFAFIGLLGAFLAKGANEPFGGIYLWMFEHVPGFIMFRDPTKWYLLIAISYSLLIPFSVSKIYDFLKFKFKTQKLIANFFVILTALYLLFLIKPALLGQLSGTFKPVVVPSEYVRLEKFVSSDSGFYRTFWVPAIQRFGFYSRNHPAISAQNLFNLTDREKIDAKISESRSLLQESAVKYVIVPEDTQGEIFLSDRKYDERAYLQTVNGISLIPWLKRVSVFGKIVVFENSNYKDHFWSSDPNLIINYKYVSPVEYSVEVNNSKKGDILVFSENFDKNWIAEGLNVKIQSSEFNSKFNSFILPAGGTYALRIYYVPQNYVNIGLIVSLVTLAGTLAFLILSLTGKNEH